MSKSLPALVLASLVTSASAQNMVAVDGMPDKPSGPRMFDGRLGMMIGGADVGDADGFSVGLSTGVGYRINDLTLRGTFDYYKVGDNADELMQRRGRASRFGGAARYSFANNGDEGKLGVDFWGEVGAGYEHVDWRQGGILDRPSLELAFGFDVAGRGERDRSGHRREIGYFMAFRSFIGQGPEQPGAMATCGGPCDEATTPSRTDISMFFDFGVHWGR
jgi:hypothetical protein